MNKIMNLILGNYLHLAEMMISHFFLLAFTHLLFQYFYLTPIYSKRFGSQTKCLFIVLGGSTSISQCYGKENLISHL